MVIKILFALSLVHLLFDAQHVIVSLAEEKLKTDVFGFEAFAQFTHINYVIRPFISILGIVAYTLLARWLVRSHSPGSEAEKV